MKTLSVLLFAFVIGLTEMYAQSPASVIANAQKSGKAVFLVVSDKSSKGTDALLNIATDASKKNKNTAVAKMDRDDKTNIDLVSKYRLAGAPLPLILVIASNGVASGSLGLKEASVDELLTYLPSKTQAEVLLGFENGKPALIVCGKKNATDKAALEAECKKAVSSVNGKANQVFIDVDNKDESNFLSVINPDKNKTTVLIFSASGKYNGTLGSNAKSDDIIKLMAKKAACCADPNKSNCK